MFKEPLMGLLDEQSRSVSRSTLEKLRTIADLDLTLERRSFLARHPSEKPYVDVIELNLKRFLSLMLLVPAHDHPFAPSIRVDELWHDLILNTRKYRSFCEQVFGTYLDHTPNQEELTREFGDKAEDIAEYTNSTLARMYGPVDMAIWGSEIMRPCYPPPWDVFTESPTRR